MIYRVPTYRTIRNNMMTNKHTGTCAIAVIFAMLIPFTANAQVKYDVSFPNAVHHEAEISMRIEGLPYQPLELRVSRTSPGRYALHEFAKNVYNVRATDLEGNALLITRPNPHQWDVHDHEGGAIISYTLYADRADGTFSQIDASHAHLNMPATFMFARNHSDWPIEVAFHLPDHAEWKVASQLFPTDDPSTYTAPNLQYFMDSPTELSDFSMRTWTVPRGPGQDDSYEIRLAIHHTGTEAEVDDYAEQVKKVVDQQIAVFGGPPAFDGGTYTFIADYLPWASGDGMEHRNSTILSSTGSLANNASGLLGTVSHEFFHAWNVERIRPADLEPFNFEQANMAGELWFAEGFTSYYTPLFIRRAGLTTDADYARAISGGLNFVINSPARKFFNPIEMSMQAPFSDRAASSDPMNFANTFISYYTWGSVIGLNLDLTLRGLGLSLDEFMRYVWQKHGKPEIPYAVAGLEVALAEYSGDAAFAKDFFDRYVRDGQIPDYAQLLAQAGFLLRKRNPGAAFLGQVQLEYDKAGTMITSNTIIGSPLYEAGLDRGDKILELDATTLKSDADWQKLESTKKPGDVIDVVFEQRGQRKTVQLKLIEDPRLEVVLFEDTGRTLSDAQQQFRSMWLNGR